MANEVKVTKEERYGLFYGNTEKTAKLIRNGTKDEMEKEQKALIEDFKTSKTGGFLKVEKL